MILNTSKILFVRKSELDKTDKDYWCIKKTALAENVGPPLKARPRFKFKLLYRIKKNGISEKPKDTFAVTKFFSFRTAGNY